MKVYTKNALTRLAHNCEAEDITNEDPARFKNEKLECVGCSVGVYGVSAALFMRKFTGEYFYVKKRTSTLFALY